MQHGTIPASLNYSGPNPYIQFDANNLRVIPEATEWPRYSGHAVAGVSGFGFGGTNAHVVVREVRPEDLAPASAPAGDAGASELPASASLVDEPDLDDDDVYLTEAERAVRRIPITVG